MMAPEKIHLTNDELASIYDYMNGHISHTQLSKELKRSRTNSYYYIGLAMRYWFQLGILQFKPLARSEELGGCDVEFSS